MVGNFIITIFFLLQFHLYRDDSNIDWSKPKLVYVEDEGSSKPGYHVALGSDNSWYLFTEKWIKMIYNIGLPNVSIAYGEALPTEILRGLLTNEELTWEKLVESEFGSLWSSEGSLETWSWSLNVPVLSSLSEDDEVCIYCCISFSSYSCIEYLHAIHMSVPIIMCKLFNVRIKTSFCKKR